MFKNVSGQSVCLFVFDPETGLPETGDAANITPYVTKDFGSVTALTDSSATELDAVNAAGWYKFDVSQTESNADNLLFSGKSISSGILVVSKEYCTAPANFTAESIDSNGRVDVIKIAGTSQTALDLGGIIADSIPADGTRPTLQQAVYMLTQFMTERSVSSTTVTVKKVDGSASLFTLTLNDATTPTGITRAT